MKFFILTDLEGATGVDSFRQTRTNDLRSKRAGMKQLAREVNACIRGIRSVYPDSVIDVWDGHGSGGLFPEDIQGGTYRREGKPYNDLQGYSAMLFIGQHAMAGTFDAPLNHTYSSLAIAYYKLNGVFIGEFGAAALIAGQQGVPTIFISGDDKATLEARMFIPNIQTCAVKQGRGLEAAEHMDRDKACEFIQNGVVEAVHKMQQIPPFTGFAPPYSLEIRYYHPQEQDKRQGPDLVWLDERTLRITSNDISRFPF